MVGAVAGFGTRSVAALTAYRGLYLEISHGGGAFCNICEVVFHERGVGNINASAQTKIGNMSGSGGLAAAFDGNQSQTFASSAGRASATGNTIGIDWGVSNSKDVDTIFIKEPSDSKIDGGNPTEPTTFVLKGTTDGTASGGVTIQTWTGVFTGLPDRPTAGWDAGATLNVDTGGWA
jgi:hypothetical protein